METSEDCRNQAFRKINLAAEERLDVCDRTTVETERKGPAVGSMEQEASGRLSGLT